MMVNKEKALKREIVSLRNLQNRGQTSSRRTRRLRDARTEYWKLMKKKKAEGRVEERKPKDKVKKEKPPKESKKKPEPEAEVEEIEEVIDDESDDEELDLDDISLEDLYDDDEDVKE